MDRDFYFWSLLEVKTFILDDFEHPVEIFFHVASRKSFKSLGCEREVMNAHSVQKISPANALEEKVQKRQPFLRE